MQTFPSLSNTQGDMKKCIRTLIFFGFSFKGISYFELEEDLLNVCFKVYWFRLYSSFRERYSRKFYQKQNRSTRTLWIIQI